MSLTHEGFIDSPKLSKPTKAGIRVISEMSTTRIILYVANRHRVGLLTMSNLALVSYLAWDKVLHIFF